MSLFDSIGFVAQSRLANGCKLRALPQMVNLQESGRRQSVHVTYNAVRKTIGLFKLLFTCNL